MRRRREEEEEGDEGGKEYEKTDDEDEPKEQENGDDVGRNEVEGRGRVCADCERFNVSPLSLPESILATKEEERPAAAVDGRSDGESAVIASVVLVLEAGDEDEEEGKEEDGETKDEEEKDEEEESRSFVSIHPALR